MTMAKTDTDDAMIDDLLADAAQVSPAVDPALMARVMADAHRAPDLAGPVATRSLWVQFGDLLGGWPAMGGLAMAGCAGLWMGFAPPATIEDVAASLFGTTETVSIWGVSDLLIDEGMIDG